MGCKEDQVEVTPEPVVQEGEVTQELAAQEPVVQVVQEGEVTQELAAQAVSVVVCQELVAQGVPVVATRAVVPGGLEAVWAAWAA
jgi:hypothetical protein